MQDIENDMDDLFRKAVDNYTLQSGVSNWDVIVSQLSEEDDTAAAVEITYKKNTAVNIIFLSLLLLIPLSTAMFSYYSSGLTATKINNNTAGFSSKQAPPEVNDYTTVNKKQKDERHSAGKRENIKAVKPLLHTTEINKNIQAKTQASTITEEVHLSGATPDSIYSANTSNASSASAEAINNQQQTADNKQQPITPKINPLQKHHLYAGVVAGLAFNEVRHQGFKKPGFEVGLIAGYTINKNMAVETGLVYSKKYYFSNGKYFSMDKIGSSMPAEMKILTVESSSNLYQIPVNIKYDIVHKKGAAIFSSAGISSYILTKEKNNYQTSMNGVQQSMKGMYKHVSAGVASSIDISVGLEHTLQKAASMRIQPYLQIPLKGMGMGSMQVMSTGIHIVYTR
jgi:hypothetical protein